MCPVYAAIDAHDLSLYTHVVVVVVVVHLLYIYVAVKMLYTDFITSGRAQPRLQGSVAGDQRSVVVDTVTVEDLRVPRDALYLSVLVYSDCMCVCVCADDIHVARAAHSEGLGANDAAGCAATRCPPLHRLPHLPRLLSPSSSPQVRQGPALTTCLDTVMAGMLPCCVPPGLLL